jgi:hypothetical protein
VLSSSMVGAGLTTGFAVQPAAQRVTFRPYPPRRSRSRSAAMYERMQQGSGTISINLT